MGGVIVESLHHYFSFAFFVGRESGDIPWAGGSLRAACEKKRGHSMGGVSVESLHHYFSFAFFVGWESGDIPWAG